MIRRLKNRKGITLVELIVAMLVMSIIMLAVTTVFLPTYNAITHAVESSETNSILNTLSLIVLSDIENAKTIESKEDSNGLITSLTIMARTEIIYTIDNTDNPVDNTDNPANEDRRMILRNGVPIQGRDFYRNKRVSMAFSPVNANGICTITLTLLDRRDGFEIATRTYAARPIGLQP